MPKFTVTERYTTSYLIEAKDEDEAREICDQIPCAWDCLEKQDEDVETLTDAQAETYVRAGWRLYGKEDIDMPLSEEVSADGDV
jgi:hypothetical protein